MQWNMIHNMEGAPPEEDTYLIAIRDAETRHTEFATGYWSGWFWVVDDRFCGNNFDIIAWMPIPSLPE